MDFVHPPFATAPVAARPSGRAPFAPFTESSILACSAPFRFLRVIITTWRHGCELHSRLSGRLAMECSRRRQSWWRRHETLLLQQVCQCSAGFPRFLFFAATLTTSRPSTFAREIDLQQAEEFDYRAALIVLKRASDPSGHTDLTSCGSIFFTQATTISSSSKVSPLLRTRLGIILMLLSVITSLFTLLELSRLIIFEMPPLRDLKPWEAPSRRSSRGFVIEYDILQFPLIRERAQLQLRRAWWEHVTERWDSTLRFSPHLHIRLICVSYGV